MHPDRKLNRLHGYDYSRNALYFVTSCVHDMICCFGQVKEHKMNLNEFGKIAHEQFGWLEQQYQYVVLHSFVVMPNHIHAIIEIDDSRVRTGRDLSVPSPPIKIKSLSELMGAYKTTTSKKIHLIETEGTATASANLFKWHRSFHDHIIRNEGSYLRISNYIRNNPANWKEDKFHN